jgi:molecular chaperone DnaJ
MASQDWFEKDFYQTLGLPKDASEGDIKKTYRKLARQYHPDSNPGDAKAEAKFKEISEAFSVLSDTEQRKEYDAIKAMGSGARFTSGGHGAGGGGFEDVFSNIFGGGRGGGFGGGFGGFDFGPTAGIDLTARTSIDFIDSIKGATIKLSLQGMDALNVKIPAGVVDGQKIKLRGKGRPSPNGGPSGDLIVTVRVKPHPVFIRDGINLRVIVPVTFTEAALGATISVPTLGAEPVKLKIHPGIPNGRVLRIKGRGVDMGSNRGDLLATVEVAVPSHLSEKAKKALLEFEEQMPKEDPRAELNSKAGLL